MRRVVLAPRLFVGALLLIAIAVMLAGVFLRYVMVPITDALDLDPVNFFWVEEVGEMLLAWMTLVGAAVGVAERTHFVVNLLTDRLTRRAQLLIHRLNHVLIAGFGGVLAWQGYRVAQLNSGTTTPGLEINVGWLYGSVVAGGILIALTALGTAMSEPTAPHHVVE